MPKVIDWIEQIRWLQCRNVGGSTIPSFGLMRITGADSDGTLQVQQPNTNGQQVVVNGPTPIIASAYGLATNQTPIYALYETSDGTPANGETWGAGASSYKLRKNTDGFIVEGAAGSGRVLVRRDVSSGGGGTTSPLTTKGDLWVYGTTDARLPVGTNGYYLVADSAETTGLKWVAASSTITTDTVDGSPSYSSIGTLRFDEADGFVLTNPTAGVTRIDIAAATDTQAGVVSTTTQFFGGVKYFSDDIVAQAGLYADQWMCFTGSEGSLSGNYDAYDPLTPFHAIRYSSASSVVIEGIDSGYLGNFLVLRKHPYNDGVGKSITLEHNGITAGTRIRTPGGTEAVDVVLSGDNDWALLMKIHTSVAQSSDLWVGSEWYVMDTAVRQVMAGGTGLSQLPTDGQLLIGSSTGYTLATLTAGNGISITNGSGSVTIASTFADGDYGDVDVGSSVTTITIKNDAVTNAKAANMAAWTYKIRNTGSTGDPSDAAIGDFTTEASPASGDFVIGFLADGSIVKYDVSNIAALAAVADDSITNAKLAEMAAYSFKANLTSGTANPTDAIYTDFTALTTPDTGDLLLGFDGATGEPVVIDVDDMPTGAISPLTTKGDLWTYSTVDARLPVGADGRVLVADSGETTGLKWVAGGTLGLGSNFRADPGGSVSAWILNVDLRIESVINAIISGNQNNFSPTGLADAIEIWLVPDADLDITGLQGGISGRVIILRNTDATYIVTLKDQDTNSSAANRFDFGADVTIQPKRCVIVKYDDNADRWYLLAGG